MDVNLCSLAAYIAFRIESWIDHSDACQSMLIPATWMIALNGRRPAE
jgi:hypothetical protein